jgi:hypothetical protein
LTLTVDFPTPPLPLPTAMMCRIPGSLSAPTADWDDARGAWCCWWSASVVCMFKFLVIQIDWGVQFCRNKRELVRSVEEV